jgi:RNA polymerase sigma-70 factor (ECF subfamily)
MATLVVAAPGAAAPAERTLTATRADARWRSIITQQVGSIWRFLRRLGVAEDALDDAVQQVFLVAVTRDADITPGSERAFLFSTALRVASLARRKRPADRRAPAEALDTLRDPAPTPDEIADRKRAYELLEQVLAEMTPELRTVFVLFELEGIATPEIAQMIGIPLGTAASRLRRARDEFRVYSRRLAAQLNSGGRS